MALKDVEFTDEEIEETVEPVMEIVDAFSNALLATIRQAVEPSNGGAKAVQVEWRVVADKVLRFIKEE